jgi:hypothetical protein
MRREGSPRRAAKRQGAPTARPQEPAREVLHPLLQGGGELAGAEPGAALHARFGTSRAINRSAGDILAAHWPSKKGDFGPQQAESELQRWREHFLEEIPGDVASCDLFAALLTNQAEEESEGAAGTAVCALRGMALLFREDARPDGVAGLLVVEYITTVPEERSRGHGQRLVNLIKAFAARADLNLYILSSDEALPYWLRDASGFAPRPSSLLDPDFIAHMYADMHVLQSPANRDPMPSAFGDYSGEEGFIGLMASAPTLDSELLRCGALREHTERHPGTPEHSSAASKRVFEAGDPAEVAQAWASFAERPYDPPLGTNADTLVVAASMQGLQNYKFGRIICAPLVACLLTADIVARTLKVEEVVVWEGLFQRLHSPRTWKTLDGRPAQPLSRDAARDLLARPLAFVEALADPLLFDLFSAVRGAYGASNTLVVVPAEYTDSLLPLAPHSDLVNLYASNPCGWAMLLAENVVGRLVMEENIAESWRVDRVQGVATAEEEYAAEEGNEMSIARGDTLHLLPTDREIAGDGWVMARNPRTGCKGYIPAELLEVQRFEEEEEEEEDEEDESEEEELGGGESEEEDAETDDEEGGFEDGDRLEDEITSV